MARFRCHHCQAIAWSTSKGFLTYLFAAMLPFASVVVLRDAPILIWLLALIACLTVSLALAIPKPLWQCRACGYSMKSNANPNGGPTGAQLLVVFILLGLGAIAAVKIRHEMTAPDGLAETIAAEREADERSAQRAAEQTAPASPKQQSKAKPTHR